MTEAATTPTAPSTTAPATPVGGAPAGATPTTGAPKPATINNAPAASYTPPAGASAAQPTAPGTYRYDTTGSSSVAGQSKPLPPVTTLVVDPPVGTKQHSTRDLRDASGNGSREELFLDYRAQGVLLDELKLTTTVSGFTDVRDLFPPAPALFVPTGVKPGAHIAFDLSGSGVSAHVVIDVLRHEAVVVAGQSVDTLVFHIVGTLSGQVTGQTVMDDWVSPQYRLILKEHATSDATSTGVRVTSQSDSVIERLTPS